MRKPRRFVSLAFAALTTIALSSCDNNNDVVETEWGVSVDCGQSTQHVTINGGITAISNVPDSIGHREITRVMDPGFETFGYTAAIGTYNNRTGSLLTKENTSDIFPYKVNIVLSRNAPTYNSGDVLIGIAPITYASALIADSTIVAKQIEPNGSGQDVKNGGHVSIVDAQKSNAKIFDDDTGEELTNPVNLVFQIPSEDNGQKTSILKCRIEHKRVDLNKQSAPSDNIVIQK